MAPNRRLAVLGALTLGLCIPGAGVPGSPRLAAPAPVRLTSQGSNLKPCIAPRPSGGFYLAWALRSGEQTAIVFAHAADDTHLSSPVRVSPPGTHLDLGAENAPSMTVDATGAIYVAWAAGSTPPPAPAASPSPGATGGRRMGGHPPRAGNINIWLARSTDDGRTFTPPVRVNDDPNGPEHRFPAVAVDRDGVCVAWLDKRTRGPGGEERARVFAARSVDGGRTFGANTDAAAGQPYPICHCCRVAMLAGAAGAPGAVAIAYRNDIADLRDMFLARSSDGGRTYGAPAPLETTGWRLPNCPMDGPSIGMDRRGGIHAVWMTGAPVHGAPRFGSVDPDSPKVLYTRVDPATARPDPPLLLSAGHHPRVAVEPDGSAVVVWIDGSVSMCRVPATRAGAIAPIALGGPSGGAAYPSVAAAPDGSVLCAYQRLMPDDSVQICAVRLHPGSAAR